MKRGLEIAALAALLGGCAPTARPPAEARPSVRKDPCAERLHEISGHLLLYVSTHKELPATAERFRAWCGPDLPPLVCPASGRPYAYNPAGIPLPHLAGRMVLYDAGPTHHGMRWGILVSGSPGGGGLVAKVVLVAEKDLPLTVR